MTKRFDFCFDLASPFGFLAERKVIIMARSIGRKVNWRTLLIGAVYKKHGGAPLAHRLKGE